MNAPSYDPPRTRPTQTVSPVTPRPDVPAAPRTHEPSRDEKKDDDHAHDEPGYGHGV